MNKPRIPIAAAEAITADLPDGAYYALMEELTGFEPAELIPDFRIPPPSKIKKRFVCPICHRRFHGKGALRQHTRDKHPEENSDGN